MCTFNKYNSINYCNKLDNVKQEIVMKISLSLVAIVQLAPTSPSRVTMDVILAYNKSILYTADMFVGRPLACSVRGKLQ